MIDDPKPLGGKPWRAELSDEVQAALAAEDVVTAPEAPRQQFVRCPKCKESVEVLDDRLVLHHPAAIRAPGRTDRCPGSRWRVQRTRQLASLVVLASVAGRHVTDSLPQRWSLLRRCPPRIDGAHANLHIDDVSPIIARSLTHLHPKHRRWIESFDVEHVFRWGLGCFNAAQRVPIAYTGGCNDEWDRDGDGNGWGRYMDAIPFNRCHRKGSTSVSHFGLAGELSGTYSGRWARMIFQRLREAELAVRSPNLKAEPITSWREGANGPWDSTGHEYANRYVESDVYFVCEALGEVYEHRALIAWRDAIRKEIAESHRWVWSATEQARSKRVGLKYEDVILSKTDRIQRIAARAIRRQFAARPSFKRANSYQLKTQSGSEQKGRPMEPGRASPGAPAPPVPTLATGPPPDLHRFKRPQPDFSAVGNDRLRKPLPSKIAFGGQSFTTAAELFAAIKASQP